MKKRATIHDIARELKLNASTVSRALQNDSRISQETRFAVNHKAKEFNYQPHGPAAALRSGKSNIVGVIIPTADRSFFGSILRGIEETLRQEGYRIIICQTYEDPKNEAAAIDALLHSRVDGIIASLSKRTTDFTHYQKVKSKGIPIVLVDRSSDELDISCVVNDDFIGAYRSVEHLINQKCNRIAHFTSYQKINIYSERLRGYRSALEFYGVPFLDELVIESDMHLEDGRNSMLRLLELNTLPDAIFSASDLGAVGALQVLKEKGIKVPQQVAICGFSNEPFTQFIDPPITSVDQHCIVMGESASKIFLRQLNSNNGVFIPRKIILTPELIIRKSSIKLQS